MILSVGLITPLITLMSYSDDLMKMGTVFGEVQKILDAPEMKRPAEAEPVKNNNIQLCDVHFAYHGKEVLHGVSLSVPEGSFIALVGPSGGGEKQRISIARAILKNAPIIFLDEATANIDPENENDLIHAIGRLTEEKTVIMIAHRLKTVKNADQILVADRGRIVQRGKHAELMKQNGIYRKLINSRNEAVNWEIGK